MDNHRYNNEDFIHLTEKGESAARAGKSMGPNTREILSFLLESPLYNAVVERLAMNVKASADELRKALCALEDCGLIAVQRPSQKSHGGPFGSYRGGMAPHEYLEREVEEH